MKALRLRRLQRLFPLLLLIAAPARAQLDLGSQDVSQENIGAYMDPFYRLIAAGVGGGRFTPRDGAAGWDLGFQAGLVPLPDRKPFSSADISALPLFRLRGGARIGGARIMARGLAWEDPRLGRLSSVGGGAAFGRILLRGRFPLQATAMAGWDRFDFSSEYTYKYRGSALGLFDQDIPADYSLEEQVLGGGLMFSAALGSGWGACAPYLQGWFEWTSGRFAYLYLDPRDDKNRKFSSDLSFPGLRLSVGALWHGAHLEAGFRSHPFFEAGWSWVH